MEEKMMVLELINEHKQLLEKRDKAIKNVEYPWNSNDTVLEFVSELQDVNDEIDEFLSQIITKFTK